MVSVALPGMTEADDGICNGGGAMKQKARFLMSCVVSMILLFLVFFCDCSNMPVSIQDLGRSGFAVLVLLSLTISLVYSILDLVFQLFGLYGRLDGAVGYVIEKRYAYGLMVGIAMYLIVLSLMQRKFCM